MATLIVDTESIEDMMSALDQLAARIAHLSTSESELSRLHVQDASDSRDLPRGSTIEFADELWQQARRNGALVALHAFVLISEVHYVFSIRDVIEFLGLPVEVVQARVDRLHQIEDRLGARLLASHWIPEDGCHFHTMHPTVRNRLSSLLLDSGISD